MPQSPLSDNALNPVLALLGLMHLKHRDSIEPLIAIIEDESRDGAARQLAVRALGQFKTHRVRAWVDDALDNEELKYMVVAELSVGAKGPWSEKVDRILSEIEYD